MARTAKLKLNGFQEWMSREGYSQATIRQYTSYVRGILESLKDDSEIEDTEVIGPKLASDFAKSAWRKYRAYMSYKREVLPDGSKPLYLPCELQAVRKRAVTVDVLQCHAVKSILDGLESMGVEADRIVMLRVGSLAVKDGIVIVTTITDDKIKLLSCEAASILTKGRNSDEPLVVSPWTGKPALYREWRRMASLASQTPIDEQTFKVLHCKERVADMPKVRDVKPRPKPVIAMPIDIANAYKENS